jgi:AcrR family transcriptional regulator
MGTLINQQRRERARAARRARMEQIVAAAAHLFTRQPFAEVTLDAIGQRAEVPHGTPSLYFGSREAVFLAAATREIRAWAEELTAELDGLPAPLADAELARLLGRSVAAKDVLSRLLSLLPLAVEHLPDEAALTAFTAALEQPLGDLAVRLEERSATLPPGEGGRLLRAILLAVAGAEPLARPRSGMALAFHDPRLERWCVDPTEHVAAAVIAALNQVRD